MAVLQYLPTLVQPSQCCFILQVGLLSVSVIIAVLNLKNACYLANDNNIQTQSDCSKFKILCFDSCVLSLEDDLQSLRLSSMSIGSVSHRRAHLRQLEVKNLRNC